MRGLIMNRPLLVSSILDHAAERYGAVEMVSCTADAPVHRTTYAALRRRAKQLARALQDKLGVRPGERVATLAWNDHRHTSSITPRIAICSSIRCSCRCSSSCGQN
jgi:acyl-CoA synthetase (AMP-forming)/AMP-acid ligase II